MNNSKDGVKGPLIDYGNPLTGVWRCNKCFFDVRSEYLHNTRARPPFNCPFCSGELRYDDNLPESPLGHGN